jgi:hypothetical protein
MDEHGQPIDLRNVQAWDGEAFSMTPGEYLFEVETATREQSSQQKPQLAFDLKVIQGLNTDVHNGGAMKHWISLAPKAAGRLVNFMNATGVVLDAEGGCDDQEFVGRRFIGEVYEDQYQKGINPENGEPIMKTSSKIRKERPEEGADTAAATPAPQPNPAPALHAPPVAPQAQRPGPALPRLVNAPLPRPGTRAVIPGSRR